MKKRVIAAIVLLPLLLLVIFAAPKVVFACIFALLSIIAAWELLAGTGYIQQPRLLIYTAIMAAFVSLNSYFSWNSGYLQLATILFFALLFGESMFANLAIGFDKIFCCLIAGTLIPNLLSALTRIYNYEQGRVLVLIPFILAFLSDTGAYFAGMLFGKHKLAPTISPKKTIEGALGGIVGAIVGILLYCFILQIFFDYQVNYLLAVLYGILGSVAAVFGDLCFSVIKRQTKIKDYGNLIPGHGGVLDRFDSMVLVAPLSEILLILLPLAVKI